MDKLDDTEISDEYNNFINENITSKNYTVPFFIQFLNSIHPDKKNLTDWSLDELNNLLSDFYLKTPNNFVKSLPCHRVSPNTIINKQIKVILQNPRVIEKSIFETSYVFYELETSEFNWLVNRRYSDFCWLRDCLVALYPGDYVPQLPKKQMGNKRFEEKFINKRMNKLQTFLDEIIINENFKSSEPLFIFLSMGDRVLFEHKMTLLNPDNVSINSPQDMVNLKGEVQILDFDTDNYVHFINRFNNLNNYLKVNHKNFIDLNTEFKELELNLSKATVNLNNINTLLSSLASLNKKASLTPNVTAAYDQFAHYFRNWSRIMEKEVNSIRQTIKNYCKININKGETYISLFKKQEEIINEYNRQKSNLLIKKDKLWEEKNIAKWEMIADPSLDSVKLLQDKSYAFSKMCYQETYEFNNLFLLLGFYFNINNEHFYNFKTEFTKDLINTINTFSEDFGNYISEELDIWTSMKSNLNY